MKWKTKINIRKMHTMRKDGREVNGGKMINATDDRNNRQRSNARHLKKNLTKLLL